MLFRSLLDTLMPRRNSRRSRRAPSPLTNRLAVESLEDRLVPAAMLTIGDASIVEGTTNAVVQVHLTEPHGNSVTVDYSTSNGSATAGSDYNAVSGKFTFLKNEMDKTILIPIRDDSLSEPNEYFTVQLANAKGAKIVKGVGNVAIIDNDPQISVTNSWSDWEGNSGTKEFKFTVSLSAAYNQTVTVDFTTINGTATAGSDYVAKSGTLTFLPGQPTSQTITVLVNGDHTVENTESFQLKLSNSNVPISNGVAYGTIYDDEPFISVTNDWSDSEGNTGAKEFKFTVSLSAAYDEPVTVDFTTADGTATAGDDYVATNGTLTFLPGQPTSQTIIVLVKGDHALEDDETFQVKLSNPSSNAQISNGVAYGTIYNDEPLISVSSWYETEGNSGAKEFHFTVSLSVAYDEPVTVDFTTTDGTATTADSDYVANSGTLTFLPGQPTSQEVTVLVNGDLAMEDNEYFQVNLSNPSSNAQISNGVAYGTIYDDDTPWINTSDVYFYYDTSYITFTVTLAVAPEVEPVTVDFTTIDGTAYAGFDYVAQSGTLTFGVGETTQYISVQVLNFNSSDIYFYVHLSNASPPAQIGNEWATAYWYYDYSYYYYYDYYYGY
jgi:hypothetical protein